MGDLGCLRPLMVRASWGNSATPACPGDGSDGARARDTHTVLCLRIRHALLHLDSGPSYQALSLRASDLVGPEAIRTSPGSEFCASRSQWHARSRVTRGGEFFSPPSGARSRAPHAAPPSRTCRLRLPKRDGSLPNCRSHGPAQGGTTMAKVGIFRPNFTATCTLRADNRTRGARRKQFMEPRVTFRASDHCDRRKVRR